MDMETDCIVYLLNAFNCQCTKQFKAVEKSAVAFV